MAQMEDPPRLNGLSNGPNSLMEHATINTDHMHHENGENGLSPHDDMDVDAGQISPSSRRRSTRASALKAQEKIKLKDGIEMGYTGGEEEEDVQSTEDLDDDVEGSAAKKRRLDTGDGLDQFSHKFGIRMREGDVYMLTDESEISSLNEQDVDMLKKNYEKILARELTADQKSERLSMIRQAEAQLRLEEAKLMMLKKIRNSQQNPNKLLEAQKKISASVPQNSSGTAYKPPVAAPISKPTNNNAHNSGKHKANSSNMKANANPLLSLAGLTQAQQQELLRNPMQAAQALAQILNASKGGNNSAAMLAAAFAAQQQKHQQQQAQAVAAAAAAVSAASTAASSSQSTATTTAQHQSSAAAPSTPAASMPSSSATPVISALQQTPQQRAAAARQAFRRQADQQLCQLASAPKAPAHDLHFVPNANQPDFCYVLGLDLVVQKVLKDKRVTGPVTEGPYECEECGTDFTPAWRAIGTSNDDLHLYCDGCVRNAQKKKIRNDHSASMRKLFGKFAAQEKEFEKQIADGKLDAALVEAAKAQQAQQQAAAAAAAASSAASQPQNLSTKSSLTVPNNLPSGSGTSTPQPTKSATPAPSTPSSSHVQKTHTPSSSGHSSSNKRSSNSSSSNAASATMANALQGQMAALAQMARTNPMMAAMMGPMLSQAMGNPNMMQQMMQMGWNPMMFAAQAAAAQQAQARMAAAAQQQAQQQQQQQPSNVAMNLFAQAVQNAQSGGSGNSNSALAAAAAAAAASSSTPNAAAMAQLAAASMNSMNSMNPAAAALLANPQLLRQMQQMHQQMNAVKTKK